MKINVNENRQFRILSAFGIILVVVGHLGYNLLDIGGLFPYYSFHVFIFLFVSGYFYRKEAEENIFAYIWRKCITLLVPYFLWNLFYGILAQILHRVGFSLGEALSFKTLFLSPFIDGHQFLYNFSAWFVPALFLIEVINVVMRKVFGLLHLKNEWLIFVGCLLFGMITVQLAIGCALLFFTGLIGGRTGRSSMETVKMGFGQSGSLLFSLLNILQLVGWTGIMIYDGALAANGIFAAGQWIWCLIIGGLIILWILIGIKNLGKLNTIAMGALFVMTILISFSIFGKGTVDTVVSDTMTFGAAVELSVAMPLSWLPLISDYTREAQKPVKATAISALVYGVISGWMYLIGMGAALFTGESDIAQIFLKAGLGIVGLFIVVLSTVTTTFLDAWSAGISSESVSKKWNGKWVAVAAAVIGTIGAIVYPMDNITNFLYLIGSVFAPMAAVQIASFFIQKKDSSGQRIHMMNLCVWLIGFIIYRLLMQVDILVGNTLPDVIITMLLCVIAHKVKDHVGITEKAKK